MPRSSASSSVKKIGLELGYAEITSTVTLTSVGFTMTAITGLDNLQITVGTRPIYIEFWAGFMNCSVSGHYATVQIFDSTSSTLLANGNYQATSVNSGGLMHVKRRISTLSPGVHTIQARASGSHTSDTVAIFASATASNAAGTGGLQEITAPGPAFLSVFEA